MCSFSTYYRIKRGHTTTTESATDLEVTTEQNGSDTGKKILVILYVLFIINKTKNLNISTLSRLKFLDYF